MLVNYNTETCNINGCSNKHHQLFLCALHYSHYVTDKKIENKLNRLYRLNTHNGSLKDKLIYLTYWFVHYSTGIHVTYIDHFPLETIFTYYLKSVYRNRKNLFSVDQFISNFDYEENVYIDHVKITFESKDFNKPVKHFAENKSNTRRTLNYSIFLIIYTINLAFVKTLNINLPYEYLWNILFLLFLISIGMFHFGIKFSNHSKELINVAYDKELYSEISKNREFLKAAHFHIQQIRTMEENLFMIKGAAFAGIILTISSIAYDNWQIGILGLTSLLLFTLLSFIMGLSIFSVLWEDRYLIPIVRCIKNETIKFDLYALDENLGINHLKLFLRSLLSYNFFTICVYTLMFVYLKRFGIEVPFLAGLIITIYFIRNFSSNFYIYKIIGYLKNQFSVEKENELLALEKSKSTSRFTKYSFIKKLKLDIFFKRKLIVNFILFISPIILSYFVTEFDDEIIEFLKQIFKSMIKAIPNR